MPEWKPEPIWKDQEACRCACGCGRVVKLGNQYINGHNRSMLNKHHSKETIEKIRKACTGKVYGPHSDETKRKMSEAKMGDRNPAKRLDVRKKLSIALTGREPSMLGKHHSDGTKRKISEATKGRFAWNKGVPRTELEKEKMSLANKGRKHSEETKLKMRASHLKMWQNSEYRESQIAAIFNGCKCGPNHPEKCVRKILNKLFPDEYKFVGNGDVWIDGKNPDFINVNGQKKIIEVFGDYWHSRKITGISKKEHRKQRQKHFAKYGYQTLVVWEKETQNPKKLKSKIKDFCENR